MQQRKCRILDDYKTAPTVLGETILSSIVISKNALLQPAVSFTPPCKGTRCLCSKCPDLYASCNADSASSMQCCYDQPPDCIFCRQAEGSVNEGLLQTPNHVRGEDLSPLFTFPS